MVGQNLVLIGDEDTRTVRAYERGDETFVSSGQGALNGGGQSWRIAEDALIADNGQRLSRVAGHIAYWFAWNGYLAAESEIYE